jgi:hypothetical protein
MPNDHPAAAEGRRLLFRFVSAEEKDYWTLKAGQTAFTKETAIAMDLQLENALAVAMNDPSFAESMHDFTMAEGGGGRAGKFIATTSDIDRLRQSTDDVVQGIVKNAEFIISFSVTKLSGVGAVSELSQSEGEVLLPNRPDALAYFVWKVTLNPFKTSR